MRTGLTPEEDLQVRRLRFDREIERDFRAEATESGRWRLRGVLAVGYMLVSAVSLELIRRGVERPTWSFLAVSIGLPALPLVAVSLRPLSKLVNGLIAIGWLATVGTFFYLAGNSKSMLSDFADRALVEALVGSCAVVLVRMPAYVVAFCGYSLFAVFCWVTKTASGLHLQPEPDFGWPLYKITTELFGATTVFVVGAYFTETLERRSFLTRRLLAEERLKTQRLIANMLPPSITEQLLERPDVIAEMHEDVTVMFADLVNFTPYAASHPASEVVGRLNSIFSRFDEIVEKKRVEKIKTIGDAYMVAAGLPEYRTDHLEAILDISLEMLVIATEMDADLRIGVQSGPVVAGVIGTKKYLYDLWGDAVNTASRMESHGLPGKIQVTESVAKQAQASFEVVERGEIDVKGLGQVRTFFVVGRKPALVTQAKPRANDRGSEKRTVSPRQTQ